MNYNYTLKYRTFDSLLEDVKVDLRNLAADTSIEPAQLYKVATRINYDLGLRINMTKETTVEVCKNKAKLPDDFFVMNFALLCGKYKLLLTPGQGTNIQEITPEYRPWVEANWCSDVSNPPQPTCLTKCGTSYGLIQVINQTVREYTNFLPIRFQNSQFIDCDCPNLSWTATDVAYIKDGWIYTNFEEGTIYLNYQGDLVDDNGNLMVPDHPMLNEYYEYGVKKRILENLVMDNVNVSAQLQLIMAEYRAARNNALTIVNTPNFSEMQKMWAANRKAMYSRYYDMFKSYFTPINFRLNNAM